MLTLLAFALVAVGTMLIVEPTKQAHAYKYSSIVRLHTEDGRFFCSGVVISKNLILTAAHCLQDFNPLPGIIPDELNKAPIEIRTSVNSKTNTYGMAYKAYSRADIGVIVGDFSQFETAPIEKDTEKIHKAFTNSITACGFPYGGSKACFTNTNLGKFFFHYTSTDGALFPGMSGGPVVDSSTGKIVGVNSAVSGDANIYAPIIALEELLGISI